MADHVRVKICGLKTADHIQAAADAGAAYVGLVFFEKSPRNISLKLAAELASGAPVGLAKVGLLVNPDDGFLKQIADRVPLDMIQLHGSESPERVAEIRSMMGLPVMKAVGISTDADMAAVDLYSTVADQILVDAKAPKGGALPGGNGLSFDWNILARHKYWTKPWMLAGGLTPDNVAAAIQLTGARQVDVSSGVEVAAGEKTTELIQTFCEQALSS